MKRKKMTATEQKLGQAPGSLVYTGSAQNSAIKMSEWIYSSKGVKESAVSKVSKKNLKEEEKQWFHMEGIHDIEILKKLGETYQIHNLFLEDVTNVDKRPTAESIESYLSVTLKYLSFDAQNSLQNHSVSFITDGNRLFSFTESGESNWIRPVIKRLENKQNSIRNKSSYYLLYALMDVLIDQYFVVLEQLNDRVDALDTDITQNVSHEQLDQLYKLKKEFLLFRKQNTIIPGVVRSIEDELDENSWESVAIFFQDLLSHTIDIQESTKSNLEGLSSMFDLYFSLLSLKMNRTIQTLTIITIVFLPLSLLTGIYGMNFKIITQMFLLLI